MKIDWTTQYIMIGKWTHEVMFEPFKEFKFLDRKMKWDCWYGIEHNKKRILDVYYEYYQKYDVLHLFVDNVKKAFDVNNENIQNWTNIYQEQYDKEMKRFGRVIKL